MARARVSGTAGKSREARDLLNECAAPNEGTGKDIVVSCKVLRGAVQHKVGAELKGPLVDGRGEGAVHAKNRAHFLAGHG